MSEVNELRQERESKHAVYIQFLEEYSKTSTNICYGFIEGKDDLSFYRQKIVSELPIKANIRLFPAGNKKSVKDVYECFDWRRFSKKRIVFFIDRDLKDVIRDDHIIISSNVYVTDMYSIENNISVTDTFEIILREVMGFATTDQSSINRMINHFEQQKEVFEKLMIPVMANIIFWKRNNYQFCNYKNINIKEIIVIKDASITKLKSETELLNYVYKKSNVKFELYNEFSVNEIITILNENNLYKKIIRGKFISTFFILMCNSIYNDCISLNIQKTNRGTTLGEPDFFRIVAPRSRIPESLKEFIAKTLNEYLLKTSVA